MVYSVNAFVGDGAQGNLAGVCIPEGPVDFQKIATQFGASETAFILESNGALEIRWFTPTQEVDLCGHATLAAAQWIWSRSFRTENPLIFRSKSGVLACTQMPDGAIALDFPLMSLVESEPRPDLLDALAVEAVEFVGRSGEYFLVQVKDEKSLRSLSPDFEKLKSLDAMGVFVTASSEGREYDFVSRCFFPKEGINEDPVTGSAHCTLGPYWSKKLGKKHLRAWQASDRGGSLEVIVHESRHRVTLLGRAREQVR